LQSFKDPNAVASIVDALRHAHGDAVARLMLIKGLTLADLIGSLLRSPIKNREAIKLANHALGSGDFLTEPQIGGTSHLSYFYCPPGVASRGRYCYRYPTWHNFERRHSLIVAGHRRRLALKSREREKSKRKRPGHWAPAMADRPIPCRVRSVPMALPRRTIEALEQRSRTAITRPWIG